MKFLEFDRDLSPENTRLFQEVADKKFYTPSVDRRKFLKALAGFGAGYCSAYTLKAGGTWMFEGGRDVITRREDLGSIDEAKDFGKFIGGTVPFMTGIITGTLAIANVIETSTTEINEFNLEHGTALANSVLTLKPEWKTTIPEKKELSEYIDKIFMLPPAGGKIADFASERPMPLRPKLTAEEHVNDLISTVNSRHISKEGENYTHQFTVQGRLPDEFKYVALALITSNPYMQDWDEYFYETEWGKVSPLIHDGGRTFRTLNPNYKDVNGRTDFILRVGKIWDSNLDEMEEKTVKEITETPTERLQKAVSEVEERKRLTNEARAYQRLALALHCKLGSAPENVPDPLQQKLSELWGGFVVHMDTLFADYQISDVARPVWFNKEPRDLWENFGKRYEADWRTIRPSLKKLDSKREKHPEMCFAAYEILRHYADEIDSEIGLK